MSIQMSEFKIFNEKNVFNKALVIREGEISDGTHKFQKLGVDREDAAAIFILNTDSNKVVLTKQFRYPVTFKSEETIFEIVAGKVNENEEPIDAAIRETEEETGYSIQPKNIKLLLSCFSTPGYSAERFFIYYATVNNADKISKGGCTEDEHEYIEIIEMDRNEFDTLIRNGTIQDAKTYLAGLHLLLHNTETK
jgi:nudix-type nucleoside diphosphatase (YffH/AdpP family)